MVGSIERVSVTGNPASNAGCPGSVIDGATSILSRMGMLLTIELLQVTEGPDSDPGSCPVAGGGLVIDGATVMLLLSVPGCTI